MLLIGAKSQNMCYDFVDEDDLQFFCFGYVQGYIWFFVMKSTQMPKRAAKKIQFIGLDARARPSKCEVKSCVIYECLSKNKEALVRQPITTTITIATSDNYLCLGCVLSTFTQMFRTRCVISKKQIASVFHFVSMFDLLQYNEYACKVRDVFFLGCRVLEMIII